MRITYGMMPKDRHDEALTLAVAGANIFSGALVPGKYLVESFPILRYIPSWFPGARFQREIAAWRRTWKAVRNKAFDDSIAKMVSDQLQIYQENIQLSISFSGSAEARLNTPWLPP